MASVNVNYFRKRIWILKVGHFNCSLLLLYWVRQNLPLFRLVNLKMTVKFEIVPHYGQLSSYVHRSITTARNREWSSVNSLTVSLSFQIWIKLSSLFFINAAFKYLNGVTRLVYATCCILLDSSLTLVCCSRAACEGALLASHFSRATFCKLRATDFYWNWGSTDFCWNWGRTDLTFTEVRCSLNWLITASNCFRNVFLLDWGIDRWLVCTLGRIKSLFISFEWFEILLFVRQILRYQACFTFMVWALRVGHIFNYFNLILAWVLIS